MSEVIAQSWRRWGAAARRPLLAAGHRTGAHWGAGESRGGALEPQKTFLCSTLFILVSQKETGDGQNLNIVHFGAISFWLAYRSLDNRQMDSALKLQCKMHTRDTVYSTWLQTIVKQHKYLVVNIKSLCNIWELFRTESVWQVYCWRKSSFYCHDCWYGQGRLISGLPFSHTLRETILTVHDIKVICKTDVP